VPAPYRYVIDLPGTPGVDAIDATSFSGWIQPDDQTAGLDVINGVTPGELGGNWTDSYEYVDDPPVPDETFPEDAVSLANAALGGLDFGPPNASASLTVEHASWAAMVALPSDDDPVGFQHILKGGRGASGSTLGVHLADSFWHGEWAGTPPVGAIGYEVEQYEVPDGQWLPIADPTALLLEITHEPAIGNGVAELASRATVNHQWGSGAVEFDVVTGLSVAVGAPRTLAASEDDSVAQSIAPCPGSPVTYEVEVTDLSTSPPYTGLLGGFATVVLGGGAGLVSMDDNETFTASPGVTFGGTYTIRPPRFRWIFATQPFRRTSPRDDALAGGAQRTWPPSKAYQAGRRTSGGIF
jgi:hypothetical protein